MAKQKGKYISDSKAKAKSHRTIVIVSICCVVTLLVGSLLAASYYLYDFQFNGSIMKNVTIAGIDVGGMTRDEAISHINEKTSNTYKKAPMVVKVFDTVVEIAPDISNATFNVEDAVDEAYFYGKRGFSSQKEAEQKEAATNGIQVDMSKHLTLDEEAIKSALSEFSKHYNTDGSVTTYEVRGEAPNLTLFVQKGTPQYGLDMEDLYTKVIEAYRTNCFTVETVCEMLDPDDIDLDAIASKYSTKPEDAKFNTDTFEVVDGINGCTLNIGDAREQLNAAPYGGTLEIKFDQIPHETTAEMLSSLLFRDKLGYHSGTQSSSSNRATNLDLACKAINGVVLLPGESFSYNETLGERTTERGYKTGIAYFNGKSVPSVGGGICQVSSTLYYCALQADLEILVREEHCYAPGYVPLGMDATVSWGTLDFSFRNNLEYPIKIVAEADGGTTTVTILGTDTKDYYIKMEYAVTATYKPDTVYEEYAPDNKEGYRDGQTIVSAATGYDVVTYRCKINKADNKEISRELESRSHFIKRDAVICKIVSAPGTETEDPSTDPTTPPTEPTTPPDSSTTEPETPSPGIGGSQDITDGDD